MLAVTRSGRCASCTTAGAPKRGGQSTTLFHDARAPIAERSCQSSRCVHTQGRPTTSPGAGWVTGRRAPRNAPGRSRRPAAPPPAPDSARSAAAAVSADGAGCGPSGRPGLPWAGLGRQPEPGTRRARRRPVSRCRQSSGSTPRTTGTSRRVSPTCATSVGRPRPERPVRPSRTRPCEKVHHRGGGHVERSTDAGRLGAVRRTAPGLPAARAGRRHERPAGEGGRGESPGPVRLAQPAVPEDRDGDGVGRPSPLWHVSRLTGQHPTGSTPPARAGRGCGHPPWRRSA